MVYVLTAIQLQLSRYPESISSHLPATSDDPPTYAIHNPSRKCRRLENFSFSTMETPLSPTAEPPYTASQTSRLFAQYHIHRSEAASRQPKRSMQYHLCYSWKSDQLRRKARSVIVPAYPGHIDRKIEPMAKCHASIKSNRGRCVRVRTQYIKCNVEGEFAEMLSTCTYFCTLAHTSF